MTGPFVSDAPTSGPQLIAYLVGFSDGTTQTVTAAALVDVDDGHLLFYPTPDGSGAPDTSIPLDDGTRRVTSITALAPPAHPPVATVNAATATTAANNAAAVAGAAATQAAAAADAAAAAQTTATTAAGQATVAVTTANGKNKVTFSTAAATSSTPGTAAGDLWWQRTSAGLITAAWEWDGTAWQPRTFGDAVLNTLTAAKITTGTLAAGVQVTIGNPTGDRITLLGSGGIEQWSGGVRTFWLSPAGDAYFSGVLSGRSSDYQQAKTGWILGSDGTASLQNVQVLQALTANAASVTSLAVKGRDFSAYLADKPLGLIAQGYETTLNLQGYSSEKGIAEISFTAYPGRGYRVSFDGPEYGASDTSTWVTFSVRATVDGSAPTVGSTLIRNYDGENPGSASGRAFRASFLWYPTGVTASRGQRVRLLLTFTRALGSGTVGINCVNNRLQMWVEDVGPSLPNSIAINGSQAASPPPAPAAAPVADQATYFTTWGASYRADGSRWSENETGWGYQGYGDSFNGDQLSLHGFDVPTIQAQLAGATITSATFYALNGWTWNAGGGYLLLGSHQSAAMPATAPPGVTMRRATVPVSRGAWVGTDCTGLFNEILAGTTQGVAFGRAGTTDPTYYAKWYQAPDPNRPRIVVNYSK